MPRHRLHDAAWASLHAGLFTIARIWKADLAALRRFVEAVIDVLRTAVAWEDLPARFGRLDSVQRRFRRWAREGIWDELFLDGIPTDALGTVMLDFSACKAQRFASGARGGGEEALGRSRGGLTTKIHAVADLAQLQKHGLKRLMVACDRCSRLAVYRVLRLIAEHGTEAELSDLLAILTGDCPARSARHVTVACGAVYPDLPDLFGRGVA
jgi:transposase